MKDYYKILGVAKNATPAEIKSAYKKLAMKHHPDRGGDNALFQDIAEAYNILSDETKRAEYDNPHSGIHININNNPFGSNFNFGNDIFNQFFQQHARQHRPQHRVTVWIGLDTAIIGGKQVVALATQNGRSTVEINIPQAVSDGESVKYVGIAPGGLDLIITFKIQPHPRWERKGLDLWTTADMNFWQLILGTTGTINTITGNSLNFNVPARTKPNAVLRLKGQGVRSNQAVGDMFIRLQATMPDVIPNEVINIISAL